MNSQVTLTQMCNAIRDDFKQDPNLFISLSPADLKETVADTPSVQIYPEKGSTAQNSQNDRNTFRGGIRHSETMIYVDVYAKTRANIGEDMAKLLPLIDAVIVRLEAQNAAPYFGLQGLKGYRWQWQRATFQYGDPQTNYAGARFTISFDVF